MGNSVVTTYQITPRTSITGSVSFAKIARGIWRKRLPPNAFWTMSSPPRPRSPPRAMSASFSMRSRDENDALIATNDDVSVFFSRRTTASRARSFGRSNDDAAS
jgi:hypothetical protein